MMRRLKLAARILLGLPLRGVRIDESLLLDTDDVSEFDYTKTAPLDLVFGGVMDNGPPAGVFADRRFRVCLFQENQQRKCRRCGGPCGRHWLVLEFEGAKKWHHLVTMHEANLGTMLGVLEEVREYLGKPR